MTSLCKGLKLTTVAFLEKRRNMARVLVIAPHPDDEVLGCGGTIVKHMRRGAEVYLCVVTKAYPPEWSEDELKERKEEVVKRKERKQASNKSMLLNKNTIKCNFSNKN